MAASISCESADEPVRKGRPLSRLSAAAATTEGESAQPGSMPSWGRKRGLRGRVPSFLPANPHCRPPNAASPDPSRGSGGGGGQSGPFKLPPPEESSAHQLYMHLHPSLWRKTTTLLIEIYKINVCPQH